MECIQVGQGVGGVGKLLQVCQSVGGVLGAGQEVGGLVEVLQSMLGSRWCTRGRARTRGWSGSR